MKELICKNCGASREIGRRICAECNKERLRTLARQKPRYTYSLICVACRGAYEAWRKEQQLCASCYTLKVKLASRTKNTNKYLMTNVPGHTQHRDLAVEVLGRALGSDEVVHHLDDNPANNAPENLIVLSRSEHGRLHQYLDLQRVILEKSRNENVENCWKALIVPLTTAWLETTSANVIRIAEIG